MAEVTVFVDDAVRGTLPARCVKEGIPTPDRLTQHQQVGGNGGLGWAALLIFLGPVGWFILIVIALSQRAPEYVSANLPFSEFAYRRLVVARRMHRIWLALSGAAAVLAALAWAIGSTTSTLVALVLACAAVGSLISALVEGQRRRRAGVTLTLDGSRRWLTISGVHPDFAQAVQHQAGQPGRSFEESGR
jgi:hypothetical protein